MSKVRVIIKPGGFITAMIFLTILVVFVTAATRSARTPRSGAAGGGASAQASPTPPPPPPPPVVPQSARTLDDWLILRPIPANYGGFRLGQGSEEQRMTAMLKNTRLVNESELVPRAGEKVVAHGKSWEWKEVTAPMVNFKEGLADKSGPVNAVAYAVAYIDQPEAVDGATLYVGSDDGVVIWLNGSEVWRNPASRSCVAGSDRVANLPLKAGRNVLVFKVCQGDFDWALTAALETE